MRLLFFNSILLLFTFLMKIPYPQEDLRLFFIIRIRRNVFIQAILSRLFLMCSQYLTNMIHITYFSSSKQAGGLHTVYIQISCIRFFVEN